MTTNLGTVPTSLEGKIVTPSDRRYQMFRSTYTTVGHPAVVVLPENASDVAAALQLAREAGLQVAVRSGGHGLSGSGTNNDGLVIDLRSINQIEVIDRSSGLVRIGAGARWAQVAEALAPHGLAISSGDHGNVGVGGIAAGGGVGWLVRQYGLTIDHIRAVEVVLPDGTTVRTDAETHPELFWVMRGAGAGAGIAVSFEIEAMELRNVGYAQLVAPVDAAGNALRRWADVTARSPRELSTAVMLSPQGPTTVAVITAVVTSDNPSVIRDALEPLFGIGDVMAKQAHIVPYTELVPRFHLHANSGQMPSSTTNGLFTGLTPEAARALVTAANAPNPAFIQLRSLGGATHDPAPSDMAFAHRHQDILAVASTFPPNERTTLAAAWNPVAPHIDGAYINFESTRDEGAFARAYPGETGTRVAELWKRYDPDGVLRLRAPA
ncbi:FAD-binding oxidoreductase [Streptomyces rubiginosohelvolus]|uniref:FAD-binding oxidoreductase n=1 Tax=Streptomyces rubiginosohelvolus TaxID=67362 RepID=UPI00371B8D23